jgi:tRNA-dihydrouridine synthase
MSQLTTVQVTKLFKRTKTRIVEMRRHYTNYFKGLPGIKPYKQQLLEAPTFVAVCELLDSIAASVVVA